MVIELIQDQYSISESEGVLQLSVSLTGQTERSISVTLDLTPVLASTDDYNSNPRTLNFNGQTMISVDVDIVSDGLFENDESFFASLSSNEEEGIVIFGISRTNVTIVDSDSKYNYYSVGLYLYKDSPLELTNKGHIGIRFTVPCRKALKRLTYSVTETLKSGLCLL